MEVLKKGTIEPLLIPLRDRLNNITSLTSVTNPKFDTYLKSDGTLVESNKDVATDVDYPMTAICEIDTTVAGYVGGEEYKLYLRFSEGTQSPILGPVFFRVEDD